MFYQEIEFACTTNNALVLKGILELGIDVNTRLSKGDSALHITCRNGFYLGAEMLIGTEANINEYSYDGLTTMQLACLKPNKQLVDLLILNGASVNNWRNGSAIPHPLHITCIMKEEEMAIALINGNADVNQIAELKRNTVYKSEKRHCITNIYDEVYSHTRLMISPLEIVCIGKMLNLNLVEVLLKNGANSNIKSLSGIKPLLIASFYKYGDLVRLLLDNKADVNVCDNIDILCLSNMQYTGEEDISELLSYGNVCLNNTKITPLHVASINNSQLIVNDLLQNRARNDIACHISPFLFAIQNDRRNIPRDR
ncbi:serine/threonine-protein phosphatase 6 regulatory ankyrin repeat subunit A-like isoform X2 [Mytilus californianus]|uniref:serine/threonine-protein phosphatase 6 regulatory ankyrin repeat subunit A-like isoform X2 n=1 Tax=Mytilus californianus TaxID=6549 RepID=UPI002247B368|nr:serine/threonine-protein phosphatase 6 regulatory ankyrin repeat subunit A-like isoform X2 [Mytilus californianus]